MKKKLLNFRSSKVLNKLEQKAINGGRKAGGCGCKGKPDLTLCWNGCDPDTPGECKRGECIYW